MKHTVALEGLNVITSTNQTNSGVVFARLGDWHDRRTPGLRAAGLAQKLQAKVASVRDARVMVLQPPPIRGLSQTGGFEFMIEDRSGKGVEALQKVVDRFQDEARKRPELAGVFSTFSARVPQLKFDVDRTKARRLDVPISDLFATLQANLGGYYVNDFDLHGKVWKVMVQAEGGVRTRPEDIQNLYVMNRKGDRVPLGSLGEVRYALGPIDVPHYNLYASAKMNGGPAPGYSSGQALAAMEEVAAEVLPEGFGSEWTGTTFQEQKTGNQAAYIFALSVVCVFLFMAALYESWIRPTVIILTVPLATFGAVVGLWLYDMPLDVFGQIGLVMLIGLETKNAILILEFGVEMRRERGMSILESAKAASRERLRPILMTSFAFVMGVLPMARATGAGAYSRNSLGIVIAFGMAVSTVLGRFVIPIYYVLGERLIDHFARGRSGSNRSQPPAEGHQVGHPVPTHEPTPGRRPLSLADGVEGQVSRR
jgi:HAE1 family hydrophobic/amphiphilic exporter-1